MYFYSNQTDITMLNAIKNSLKECDFFYISVSFIKFAGINLIKKDLQDALNRGVAGKFITSTYQNFTDVESLRFLNACQKEFHNFDVRLEDHNYLSGGFHVKGYLFSNSTSQWAIVGSTNLTLYALKKNAEWNLSTHDQNVYENVLSEFNDYWSITQPLDEALIETYRQSLSYAIERWDMDYSDTVTNEVPNAMQKKALKELKRYRDMGQDKALVIAATGSGKTHLAAFDFALSNATTLLFVVHRESILKKAIETFKSVVNRPLSYTLFTGPNRDTKVDCVFTTNLTLANHLEDFSSDYFEYIVFDEVHHAKASTYQKIWNYFQPQFTLGLTATPDRLDDPEAIFDLFENNVPLDLRLREAIENKLVVPFHYYGISSHFVNYSEREASKLIKEIAQHRNIDLIDEELKKKAPKNEKLKALAFCVNRNHARSMAEKLAEKGYGTIALSGKNATRERIQSFQALQDESHPLEIIFTIDILNEGVDIPRVNTVLFLRPTESPIVFLQQLGRGLRKVDGKDYLTVLDFIGNSYKRSIQIIRALISLHPHQIFEKKTIVDLVKNDFKALDLPGVTIKIDDLSKEEIITQIESTNFNQRKYLVKDYENFKEYLGVEDPPTHMDYLTSDVAPDLIRFMQAKIGKKNRSYYAFLKKIGEDVPAFNDFELYWIDTISEMLPLVRFEEFLILDQLLERERISFQSMIEASENMYQFHRPDHMQHALNYLIQLGLLELREESYYLNIDPSNNLRVWLRDLIDYGLTLYGLTFKDTQETLVHYQNYRKEQIMLATLQDKVYVYQKGTKIEKDGTVYLFVNLKKDRSLADHLQYNDVFIDEQTFLWESQTQTTMQNTHGQKLIHSKEAHLFVRREESEDGIAIPYTYVGTGKLLDPKKTSNEKDTLAFKLELDQPLPIDLQFDFGLPESTQAT